MPTTPTQVANPPPIPTMIWDGECRFCARWIARWRQITGDRVEYVPFQDPTIASRYPELPLAHFEAAVHLVETDGTFYWGAEAVVRALAHGGKHAPLWCYQKLPLAEETAEAGYKFIAEHRGFFSGLTRFFFGNGERTTYFWTRWIFLRLLGFIFLVAFASLWTQLGGLVGTNGILPSYPGGAPLPASYTPPGMGLPDGSSLLFVPTGKTLNFLCGSGVVLSVLLIFDFAPALLLFLLWGIYLALSLACRDFFNFQWDILLLETGLLAIFLAPWRLWPPWLKRCFGNIHAADATPSRLALWLLWWLLFRLMFQSGLTKLLSGDPTWRLPALSALTFHYETQPIPTWIGWYAHQLPLWFQKFSTVVMFIIEIAAPFLIFIPRRWARYVACGGLVFLQVLIGLTGNYNFFNLLSIALSLLLLDDTAWRRLTPRWLRQRLKLETTPTTLRRSGYVPMTLLAPVAIVTLITTTVAMMANFGSRLHPRSPHVRLFFWTSPLRSTNSYGLFRSMTQTRPELIVEGSDDGQTWRAYEFKWKAGDLSRRPGFVEPHQPRLDWQMWFEALHTVHNQGPSPWFLNFCARLLQGQPEVLALLADNPFPDRPPRFIRVQTYEYHFTDFAERRETGHWWQRELKGVYLAPKTLRDLTP